ncbi:MAG: phosphoribosyltransferase [Flavobacteriales bacterium]|nr:phosphoribosyltransferase [Flavobacteriales bacterium]
MRDKSIVLTRSQIDQKIDRIAFEIYENSFEENVIYLGGISGNGFLFAERLVAKLSEISDQSVRLFELSIDKDAPLEHEINLSVSNEELQGSTMILVDDVINSGRTMSYAVRKVLENKLKVLKIATLVNRTHRRFPVHADFVGLNIATTLKDNIVVQLDGEEVAYLD